MQRQFDADAGAAARIVARPHRSAKFGDDFCSVFDKILRAERINMRHRTRLSEALLIKTNHTIVACQMRHPRAPRGRAFGKAVDQQHRFRQRQAVDLS